MAGSWRCLGNTREAMAMHCRPTTRPTLFHVQRTSHDDSHPRAHPLRRHHPPRRPLCRRLRAWQPDPTDDPRMGRRPLCRRTGHPGVAREGIERSRTRREPTPCGSRACHGYSLTAHSHVSPYTPSPLCPRRSTPSTGDQACRHQPVGFPVVRGGPPAWRLQAVGLR